MKKFVYILIFILIIVVIICSFFIISNTNIEKEIIIEKYYMNWASGFHYRGSAICDDGTIYTWNFEGDYGDYIEDEDRGDLDKQKDWIIKNGKMKLKKVKKEDLKILKELTNSLVDSLETKHTAYDVGSNSIEVWKNEENKKITLIQSGDFSGKNKTEESEKILKIVNKYLLN